MPIQRDIGRLLAALLCALSTAAACADAILLRPSPALTHEQRLHWAVGRSFALKPWVSAPASTTARDGLGPWFNARNCAGCHPGNGQGELPERGLGLILRLAPDSPFGQQLQDQALPGFTPEGQLSWSNQQRKHPQGPLPYRHYVIAEQPAQPVSARLAPMLLGMGLLDGVDDADILAWQDPDDGDGDGISGRAAILNPAGDSPQVGRFGWKAAQASLREQVAQAFAEDLGIDNPLRRAASCAQQAKGDGQLLLHCQRASGADRDGVEISESLLDAVVFYVANLAMPAAAAEPHAAGQQLFQQLGCAACHRPALPAGKRSARAYSDLLLHDMGAALADPVAEGDALGSEWRTAPLWGLGIRSREPDNTRLLHDGRARSIAEAIHWHGGEGQRAAERFQQLSADQQASLIQFLKEL